MAKPLVRVQRRAREPFGFALRQEYCGEKDMGTWTAGCVPDAKPDACTEAAWTALAALEGDEALPACTDS